MPAIPKKFPILEVSGEDNPLNAKINSTPVRRYNSEDKLPDIKFLYIFLFTN